MLPFSDFYVVTHHPLDQLKIDCKPVDPNIEGGEQKQQLVNIECNTDFKDPPVLNISYTYVPMFRFIFVLDLMY